MPEETFQEKTEPSTPRRKREARRRGQVAKSQEVNSLLILTAGFFLLRFLGPIMLQKLYRISSFLWGNASIIPLTPSGIQSYFYQGMWGIFELLLPIFLGIAVVGIVTNLMQVGFLFTTHPLAPDLNRINPVGGLRRLFSKQALVRMLVSVLKIGIVGYIAYITIRSNFPQFFSLMGKNIAQILIFSANLVFELGLRCCLGIVPLAVLDYAFQRWQYERGLRMTRQEVREELKQTEGNPQVRARIRSLQRQIARHRMMQEVPQADVVITNPTRLAVALKYDRESMNAPVVVAKGARLIAEKIRELAERYNVPLVENRWLAEALYKTVEIGQEIPIKFYQAVAEILAYIYRLKKKNI